jgi:hypothetical protein
VIELFLEGGGFSDRRVCRIPAENSRSSAISRYCGVPNATDTSRIPRAPLACRHRSPSACQRVESWLWAKRPSIPGNDDTSTRLTSRFNTRISEAVRIAHGSSANFFSESDERRWRPVTVHAIFENIFMPTTVHIPDPLLKSVDRRAKALGISRNRLVVRALEQAVSVRADWSPEFLQRLRTVDRETSTAVDELLTAVTQARRSKEPRDL